jgi:hypothetical protein
MTWVNFYRIYVSDALTDVQVSYCVKNDILKVAGIEEHL